MPETTFINLYSPALLIVLALVWGLGRILYLNRTSGVSVLAVLKRKKTHDERLLALTAILLNSYLLMRPVTPQLDSMLYTIPSPAPIMGSLIIAAGIGLAILSQIRMGKSWRIGIPEEKEDEQTLVTTGLYAYSRNPIYVGIMLFLIGCVITVPGPLSLIAFGLSAAIIPAIIAREEAFLIEQFGDAYRTYCSRVRRWL